jgi:hypothetical protein
MGVAIALVLSAAFGAGDQYLGSGHVVAGGWTADVSLLSAPWLVLAFVAGSTQKEPRRAALLGLGCTIAAILGYMLLTDSPLEGAHYSLANARAFFVSDPALFIGGLFTGPLFGWFGQQWRTRRALAGALVSAAALCLEPLARRAPLGSVHFIGHEYMVTTPITSHPVVVAEIAAGLLLAAYVLAARVSASRSA